MDSRNKRVLCAGMLCVDLIYVSEEYPQEDEKVWLECDGSLSVFDMTYDYDLKLIYYYTLGPILSTGKRVETLLIQQWYWHT